MGPARYFPQYFTTGLGSPVDTASLLASARRHAARGMRARAAEEHDDAALQLGIMLEHLAKAYLADLHPTLLIEARVDLLSLLRLAGQGQRIKAGHVLKTVGMAGALERIGTIQAGGTPGAGASFARRFDVVLHARNGVAHVGDDGGASDDVAQLAVRGAAEVLQMMGRSLGELFLNYTGAAEALLDEHGTKLQRLVTLRVAQAEHHYRQQWSDLTEEQRGIDLAVIDRMTTLGQEDDDGQLAVRCPACKRLGVLKGSPYLELEPDESRVDETGQLWVSSIAITVLLSVDSFRCPVCGLRLQGREQVEEAGLPTSAVVRPGNEDDLTARFGDLNGDDSTTEDDREPND